MTNLEFAEGITDMIQELEMNALIRGWLESYIEHHERPDWHRFFGLYPQRARVEAARMHLEILNHIGASMLARDEADLAPRDSMTVPVGQSTMEYQQMAGTEAFKAGLQRKTTIGR